MIDLLKQWSSLAGAGFAAACCLGLTAALSILTAIGAGFLIRDAILIPVYVGLLALSVWLLYRSARSHANLMPFWLGLAGAVTALAGLWIAAGVVYVALAALVAASVWDFRNARHARAT